VAPASGRASGEQPGAAGFRLTADLQSELSVVRDAAAELLGLTLAVPGQGDRLAPDLRFFYLGGEQAGQTELLAGAIRRRLPSEAARRRARAYLHREAASLVPQQIGRARGDLQYRLAEATRQLVRAVGARYAESTFRLESALWTAAAAREATTDDTARLDRGLSERQRALGQVITLLEQATADTAQTVGRGSQPQGCLCQAVTMSEDPGRRLVLFRHAKSAWPDVADHDRPLARRGQRDAPVMGRWLRDAGLVPDQVLCSTARRARQTWQLAQASLDAAPPVTFERGVYEGTAADLLALIRQVPSAAGSLLVLGHNPAIEDLALMLAATGPDTENGQGPNATPPGSLERMRAKFPTAAIASLEFPGTWPALTQGQARLTAFVTPRDLAAQRATGS